MERTKSQNKFFYIFKGLAIAILFTIIALSLFSILLVYTNLSEETIEPVILVVTGISILVGSSFGLYGVKKHGLLYGGIIGGLYILLIYFISSFIGNDFSLNSKSIVMIASGIIGGVIGGVISINVKFPL